MYKNGAREFVLGKSGLFKGDILLNLNKINDLFRSLSEKE